MALDGKFYLIVMKCDVLDEGMITSNEPGVYCEGKFGIRHENEMVVVKGNVNNYGQFMHF